MNTTDQEATELTNPAATHGILAEVVNDYNVDEKLLSELAESGNFPQDFLELMNLSSEDFAAAKVDAADEAEHGHVYDPMDPFDDERPLQPCQIFAINVLIAGGTQIQAATAAGKSARWIWSQLNEPGAFRQAYVSAVDSMTKQLRMQALQKSTDVMETLVAIASDPENKQCLAACQMLIDVMHRRK